MDGSSTPHENVPRQAGQGAGDQGNLAVLGETSPGSLETVHPKVPEIKRLRRLRPSELMRLVNSTPLGSVLGERTLYRHRLRAGHRVENQRRIDLLYYTAWLIEMCHDRQRSCRSDYWRNLRRQGRDARASCEDHGSSSGITVPTVLELIERQHCRCALTGRRLTPSTAALDHVVSISRGGRHCIENAQVLHKEVNRAKGTMTNEEFIRLCYEVVAHANRIGDKPKSQPNKPPAATEAVVDQPQTMLFDL
jgi:5-methylcytosine-specific restriction endonuclease McrA